MKVICAGAPKTGTKSIAKALRILGYKNVYDAEEAIEFALDDWTETLSGKRDSFDQLMLETYKDVDAVVDLPHSYFFDEFHKYYPDAKVILMLRDEDAWYKSFKGMCDYAAKKYWYMGGFKYISPSFYRFMKLQDLNFEMTVGSFVPNKIIWQKYFKNHNSYVREVTPKHQLLEYSVKEGWEPICNFLGKPVPDMPFPRENVAMATGKESIVDRTMEDTWIMKKAIKEIKLFFLIITILISVIVGYKLGMFEA